MVAFGPQSFILANDIITVITSQIRTNIKQSKIIKLLCVVLF